MPQNDDLVDVRNIGYMFSKAVYRMDGTWQETDSPSSIVLDSLTQRGPSDKKLAELCKPYRGKESPFDTFDLQLIYPGLYAGMGYAHGINGVDSDFKTGFSFDYTTGLPYIPGSSLKGMLRSHFLTKAAAEDTLKLLNSKEISDIQELADLERAIFGNRNSKDDQEGEGRQGCVVFHDVFPVMNEEGETLLMADDYITPHPTLTGKVTPIRTIKLRPGTTLRFYFSIPQEIAYQKDKSIGGKKVLELFKQLLIDWGLGAKTRQGYGNFKI